MNNSFPLARIAGIPIRVHITFALILIFGMVQWGIPYGLGGAFFGLALMLLLFVCVTLHELGHALAARAVGIGTRDIILLPIGGVALLERNPREPRHELLIALAGPAVNVVLAIGLGIMAWLFGMNMGNGFALPDGAPSPALLLTWLFAANISLVLFNLIPAFPLDGGRVLRALLAMRLGEGMATRLAVRIGRGIAAVMGIFGLFSFNLALMLIALFIYLSSGQEQRSTEARVVLNTRRVGDVYNRHALTVAPFDRISMVVDYLLTGYQPDFAVMQGGRVVGIVTRDDVLKTLAQGKDDPYIADIMQTRVLFVPAEMTLDEVQAEMEARQQSVVAVHEENGAYLGLVSLEDLAEAYVIIAHQEQERYVRGAVSLRPTTRRT
jgi:Zn-dependent protease/predicted transcriptional regulator